MSSLLTSDVVEKIAEKLTGSLPLYVPAMPSILVGIYVMLLVIAIFTTVGLVDRRKNTYSDNLILRTRWIGVIIIGILLGSFIGDYVQGKHYTILCIKTNRQHYANVHWLRLYTRAVSGAYPNT